MIEKPIGTEPHYLIPLDVYESNKSLIDKITGGEFNPNAMYNIVFLYTDPKDAQWAGTVLYGKSPEPYIEMVNRMLLEIGKIAEVQEQEAGFRGLHAYLREGMFVKKKKGVFDPCASKNPAPPKKKRWFSR